MGCTSEGATKVEENEEQKSTILIEGKSKKKESPVLNKENSDNKKVLKINKIKIKENEKSEEKDNQTKDLNNKNNNDKSIKLNSKKEEKNNKENQNNIFSSDINNNDENIIKGENKINNEENNHKEKNTKKIVTVEQKKNIKPNPNDNNININVNIDNKNDITKGNKESQKDIKPKEENKEKSNNNLESSFAIETNKIPKLKESVFVLGENEKENNENNEANEIKENKDDITSEKSNENMKIIMGMKKEENDLEEKNPNQNQIQNTEQKNKEVNENQAKIEEK